MVQSSVLQDVISSDLITAAIQKRSEEATGLFLYKCKQDDSLIVTKMAASSKFWFTRLSVGMKIISINNADASKLTENSAQIIMQTSAVVVILAKYPEESVAPGALVTAVVKKELEETKCGVVLIEKDNKVVIDEVVENSLADETRLKGGMEMLRIDNFECVDKKQSADLLRLKTGLLTMIARVPGPPQAIAYYVTATIPSFPSRRYDMKVIHIGLEFEQEENGPIVISDIDRNGPYVDSKLRVGMELVSINNIRPRSVQDAKALLERACDYLCLTVLAMQRCKAPPGALVTASLIKETADQTLGILLGMNEEGRVAIKRIQDNSPISRTKLEPGMVVHSVGNIPARGKHNTDISRLMAGAARMVTILAEAPTASGQTPTQHRTIASLYTATLYKRLRDMRIGIKVARKNGRMVVSHLENGGLAAATGLRVGMNILKINNVDCTAMSAEDATTLFTEVNGIVTFLAHMEVPIRQLVTASLDKTTSAKVGIRLRSFKGSVAITNITKETLAASTDLLGGMLFKSINNIDCTEKQPEEVASLLRDGNGIMIVLAATPDFKLPTSSFVTAIFPPQTEGVEKDIFKYEGGKLMVSEWGASGVFFGSSLRTGMEILTLNNMDSDTFSMAGVLGLMEEETVTILAKRPELKPGLLITEVIEKESLDVDVGLEFSISDGRLMIASIKDGSVASRSKLMVGMQVFMIDNAMCFGLSSDSAMDLVTDAVGDFVVVAGTPSGNASERPLVVASFEKKSKGSEVGLTFGRPDKKLTITKIIDDSLAADLELSEGMEVLSINNIDCTQKTPADVNDLFSMAEGRIIILAERPREACGDFVTAAIIKNSVDTLLGVTMVQKDEKVYFKYINPEGPAGGTDLRSGMKILSINDISCSGMSVQQVVMLLRSLQGVITVLAQITNLKFEEPKEEADDGSLNGSDVTMDFDPNEENQEEGEAENDIDIDVEEKGGEGHSEGGGGHSEEGEGHSEEGEGHSEEGEGQGEEGEGHNENGSVPEGFNEKDANAWD